MPRAVSPVSCIGGAPTGGASSISAMDLTIVHRLGMALALGLVVGMERGWQARESTEGLRNIGVRTFAAVSC